MLRGKFNIFDTYGFMLKNVEIFEDSKYYATYYTLDSDKNIISDIYETQYLQFPLKSRKTIKEIKKLDIVSAIKYIISDWNEDYDEIKTVMQNVPSCFYENTRVLKYILKSLPNNQVLLDEITQLIKTKQAQMRQYRIRMQTRESVLDQVVQD